MRNGRRFLVLAMLLGLAGGSLPVLADSSPNDLERNRQVLEQARKDPAKFARLQSEYQDFLNLSPERLKRLRKLDQELRGSPDTYRLHRALEKYANWLERLPEDQRRRVESAANETERLKIIKEIRQSQWVDRLPTAERKQVLAAQGEKKAALIKQIRQEEKRRKQEWNVSLKHWEELTRGPAPTRASELPLAAEQYIARQLLPRLSDDERGRLTKAEGSWPAYLQTLVELNDKVFQIPGPVGPRRVEDLPPDVQRWVNSLPRHKRQNILNLKGKWPEFALKVAEVANKSNVKLPPLAPAEPAKYPDNIKRFIHNALDRHFNDWEKNRLQKAAGQWPKYPKLLMEFSRKHGLQVPGTNIPGPPPNYWDKYRKTQGSGLE